MKIRKILVLLFKGIWRFALVLGIMIVASNLQGAASAQTVQRPISDFIEAQGTQVDLGNPRGALYPYDYVGWLSAADDPPIRLAVVDYAGVTNDAMGLGLDTKFSGKITERLNAVALILKGRLVDVDNIDRRSGRKER